MPVKPPFTIVIYKDFFSNGRGAGRATAALANALVNRGFTVHVITRQLSHEPLFVTFKSDVCLHFYPIQKAWKGKLLLNKILLRTRLGMNLLEQVFPQFDILRERSAQLQLLVSTLHPDIVIAAGTNESVELMHHTPSPLAIPWVQMFHVYPPVCFKKNKYQRVRRLERTLRTAAACQVLLPSHEQALRPYTSAPIAVIGNALPYAPKHPLPQFTSRNRHMVYVAYFSKDKNHAMLLRAFARLTRSDAWILDLYGSGTPQEEQQLHAQVEALGIASRVRFMGITTNVRSIFEQAGICVYPSRVEGFGLALAEAMWFGLPCVGFRNAPGVNELIQNGDTGLLAEEFTAESFAVQLQRLIDNPSLRERLGESASRFVRARYTEDVVFGA